MNGMKVGPNCDIKSWSKRFNTFQEFLPRCLWIAGAKEGKWPEAYDKERKRDILEFALSKEYQAKLNSEGWCLSENTYDKSITRIKEIEPEILRVLKEREEKRANAKAITELQQKAGIPVKSSSMKSGQPRKFNTDKNKSNCKPDGEKDANNYYNCGNCGKTHKGVCHKLVAEATTTNDQNTSPKKEWMSKRAAKNYIHKIVASETKKKKRKGKRKRRYSSDSSGSESSSSKATPSWRSGMSGAEQMHMILAAGLGPNDSDIEFEPDDGRHYRKQAKKWSKSKGKRIRR